MNRYHSSGAPNPDFPYKVFFPDLAKGYLTLGLEQWLNDYPSDSRYYVDYRWAMQDESWAIQFEDEQIAILFALKWQGR